MSLAALEIGLDWFPEHGGGLDRYFMELVQHAPKSGMHVRGLVAGRPKVADESNGQVVSFAPRSLPLPLRLLAARRAIVAELATGRHDLVASHFALHGFAALDQIKVPLVCHFQGPWAQESRSQGLGSGSSTAKRLIERVVYRRAQRCITLSESFKTLLVEQYGVDPDRVVVSPGAIDTRRFADAAAMTRTAARAALGWPTDRPIALAVRRLVPRMGLGTLIAAIKDVVHRHGDVLLMIAGRGPERTALGERIEALGLERNVRLLGYVTDEELPLAYRAADLSVTPTLALEGFGLITVEAMAAGTPAMVTPVGGLPEIVAPFAPDLVLSDSSQSAIAQGLDNWLRGMIRLPKADACRRYVEQYFSWPVSLRRIRDIYAQALT